MFIMKAFQTKFRNKKNTWNSFDLVLLFCGDRKHWGNDMSYLQPTPANGRILWIDIYMHWHKQSQREHIMFICFQKAGTQTKTHKC